MDASPLALRLAEPGLREALLRLARRGVPDRDAEDIVQETLTDALASRSPPEDLGLVRSWACGIARHKIGDFHRRHAREDLDEAPVSTTTPETDAADLARWALRELPANDTSERTLEWMLREGEGEKLEGIAEGEALPPSTVRQRVSRLRRFFRERWREELALLAALGVLVAIAVWLSRPAPVAPAPDAGFVPPRAITSDVARGAAMRKDALARCAHDAARCIKELDDAKALDPDGDRDDAVQRAREDALRTLAPQDSVTPAPPRGASKPAPKRAEPCTCAKRDPMCGCW